MCMPLVLALVVAPPVLAEETLLFKVVSGSLASGDHCLTVKREEGTTKVRGAVHMKALGGLGYSFKQCFLENWQDGKLQSFHSTVRENGAGAIETPWGDDDILVKREEGALVSHTPNGSVTLPEDAAPHTFWDRKLLESGHFFNSIVGTPISASVETEGERTVYDDEKGFRAEVDYDETGMKRKVSIRTYKGQRQPADFTRDDSGKAEQFCRKMYARLDCSSLK